MCRRKCTLLFKLRQNCTTTQFVLHIFHHLLYYNYTTKFFIRLIFYFSFYIKISVIVDINIKEFKELLSSKMFFTSCSINTQLRKTYFCKFFIHYVI